jgi:hypothetical protein
MIRRYVSPLYRLARAGWTHGLTLLAVMTMSLSTFAAEPPGQSKLQNLTARELTAQAPPSADLTAQDRALDCAGIRGAIADVTLQLKKAGAQLRKDAAAPPASLAKMFETQPDTQTEKLATALRNRSKNLGSLSSAKGCDRLDAAFKSQLGGSRLGGAIKPKPPEAADRCQVRGELGLKDCVEDIAKWRCRDEGKSAAYIVCLDKIADKLITASGFDSTAMVHYDPGCGATIPATCSVFADNRNGPDVRWCKRLNEATIEVCDPPKAGAAVAAPVAVKNSVVRPAPAAASATERPAGATCRPLACALGTCERLCAAPD